MEDILSIILLAFITNDLRLLLLIVEYSIRKVCWVLLKKFFFNYHEFGGAYWDKNNPIAQKAYTEFNPIEKVGNWDTPILVIHGGKDYRVPEEQGFQAFTAAQLRGI